MSLFRLLLLVIAGSTQRELARQVRYLKVENEILRSKLPARLVDRQSQCVATSKQITPKRFAFG